MEIFGKFLRKKKKEEPAEKPVTPSPTLSPLFQFALGACHSKGSILIQMSQTAELVDELKDALQIEYLGLDPQQTFSHAQSGLTLKCPKCGQFSKKAVPLLYLAGKGQLEGTFFGGTNVEALARGVCPLCRGSTVEATFDPARIMTRYRAMRTSILEAAVKPELTPVYAGLRFQSSLDISPDETMICFVAPREGGTGAVVAYEAGTTNQIWSLSVSSAQSCRCVFVEPERVLILSEEGKDRTAIRLVNARVGSIVAESEGPKAYFSRSAADAKTGSFVTESSYDTLLMVKASGNELDWATYKCGQICGRGPKIGPDGKCYVIVHYHLYRVDDGGMNRVMKGDNGICFDPAGKVYCGGGYPDRSGESALHIADIQSGTVTEIPYGTEPIDQIALAGPGRLLLASIVDERYVGRYPNATVTLFSLPEQRKIWSLEISDLKPWRDPILVSVPSEDWALIQTGSLLKKISLQDGKNLGVIPNRTQDYVEARCLTSRKAVYITRNPVGAYRQRGLGMIECYRA